MIRSIAAVLVGAFFPLALACAAGGEPGIPQLESSTVGWSKVADDLSRPVRLVVPNAADGAPRLN